MSDIPNEPYAIQPGARIVVTGANGYIASHIIDTLLSLGYLVRGTIRSEKQWLDEFFESKYGQGRFETVVVPRLDDEQVLARVLSGVIGLVHVASEVSLDTDAGKIINSVVSTTEALLKASAEASVKRVVLTSSSLAAQAPHLGDERIAVTEDSWNDDAVEKAWDEKTPADEKALYVYAASKTEGERAAWKWVEKNNPDFVFNSVLPAYCLGQNLHPAITGSTMKYTAELLRGNDMATKFFQPGQGWQVNTTDAARLHVIALLDSHIQSERIFAFASSYRWAEVISILQKLRPSNKDLPDAPENELADLCDVVLAKKAENMLSSFFGQDKWIGLEQSLKDGIDSMGY